MAMTPVSEDQWDCEVGRISAQVYRSGKRGEHICHLVIPMWAADDPDDTHGRKAEVRAQAKAIAALPEAIRALRRIAECETPSANATVKRMAAIARDALSHVGGEDVR